MVAFDPQIGCGPLRFGMSKREAKAVGKSTPGWSDFCFKKGGLAAFTGDPDQIESLMFNDQDLLAMSNLDVALHIAKQSDDFGQALGGSLFFMDLGLAILQFESHIREFVFFNREYDPGEPLKQITLEDIRSYHDMILADAVESNSASDSHPSRFKTRVSSTAPNGFLRRLFS